MDNETIRRLDAESAARLDRWDEIAFAAFPPGTVTVGKPEERADGATAWPFTVAAWRILTAPKLPATEPVATPTVVETREERDR